MAAMPRDAINPDALEAFAARADEGPVYMLNLIAPQPDGGAFTLTIAPQ